MISTTTTVGTDEFERQTGWAIKPEGACKDDRCIPLPRPMADAVDLHEIAGQLNMPLIHDEDTGLWCLGPEAGGKALASSQAPDLELPDWHGDTFRLASLRGTKVLLVAWATW